MFASLILSSSNNRPKSDCLFAIRNSGVVLKEIGMWPFMNDKLARKYSILLESWSSVAASELEIGAISDSLSSSYVITSVQVVGPRNYLKKCIMAIS